MSIEQERRRSTRWSVTLPVRVTHPALGNLTGATRNISASGVYFYIESDSWQEGASIEYVLQIPSEITRKEPMTIVYIGRVVRVEQLKGKMAGIAVEIESFTPLAKQ